MKEKTLILVHRVLKFLNTDDRNKLQKKIYRVGKNEAGNIEKNKNLICIRIFSEVLDARISDAMPLHSLSFFLMPLHSEGKNVEIKNPYT